MLAELLGAVANLVRKGDAAELKTDPAFPRKAWLVQAGTATELEVPPRDRRYAVEDIETVVGLVEAGGALFHTIDEVNLVFDLQDRRELATMRLHFAERFATVSSMARQPWRCSPQEAIKKLRFELHAANVDHVVAALRRIDFQRSSSGSSHIEHGKESLGRAVEAKVQQADAIPESFAVRVPVYSNRDLRSIQVDIQCGIYLDLAEQLVEIRVMPDEISKAIEVAQAEVGAMLAKAAGDAVPVYHGRV